ncbi:MAG: T9SS type A sorting domain-containing protein [Bacteroidia bacterium]
MKKPCAIFFLFLLASAGLSQNVFQKTFGGTLSEYVYSVQQTSDGGYILCGTKDIDTLTGNTDAFIIKTNSAGDTLWSKIYGGTSAEYGEAVRQTSDGGYVLAGITGSFGAGVEDIYVVKTNSTGDTLWTKTYGTIYDDLGLSIEQTTDGGYVIAGHTESNGAGKGDFYCVKLDATGDTSWTKTYGGPKHDHAFCGTQTNDGGFIFVGHTVSFGGPSGGFYAVKTNSSGDTLWTRVYGGTTDSYCYTVIQTSDNGYAITGYTDCFGAGGTDFYLVKTNSTGDTLWTKTYGSANDDYSYGIDQTSDGGYIIAGTTSGVGGSDPDILLIKTNGSGDTLWTKTFGGAGSDNGFSVAQTSDGGYIIGGTTSSFGNGIYDAYLIKTDANGNSGCMQNNANVSVASPATLVSSTVTQILPPQTFIENTSTTVSKGMHSYDVCGSIGITSYNAEPINIYPNPSNGKFFISGNNAATEMKVIVYNMFGEIVYNNPSLTRISPIEISPSPEGIYLVHISVNGAVQNRKILVNK